MNIKNIAASPILIEKPRRSRKSFGRPIRLMSITFVFYMSWVYIVQGLPVTVLGKALHMSEFGFALLGGLLTYSQFAQLLGSYFVERYGHRKLIVILGGIVHRAVWLAIAILPLFANGTAMPWQMMLLFACISFFGAAFIGPGAASWIADLVPGRLQGRFCARRMQFGLLTSIASLMVASYVLDKAQAAGVSTLRIALMIVFAFASIAGITEFIIYMFVPDPPRKPNSTPVNLLKIIWKPLADKEFCCYLGMFCTVIASTVFMGFYTFLFYLDVLKMSNLQVTILMTLSPNLLNAVCFPFWGRIADRVGYKPAFAIGMVGSFWYATWFLLATPGHWIGAYIWGMAGFAFTSAFDTATAVLMYNKISGQADTDFGSAYPAVGGVASSMTALIISIIAGYVASSIGMNWRGSLLNYPVTCHTVMFAVTVGIRLVALIWLIGIKNPKQYTAPHTIRVIGEEFKNAVLRTLRISR